ncbi:hypothetical protein [Acinetobacter sp. YH01009]|uniref:hypothetical protein n=1 Tax=Acinetobacter TaxID=469 RepID=UPI0015D10055|nr:hypothetical protein [Acinetobacter sp. YH01009]
MVLTDLIAVVMLSTWFLTVSEYKEKLINFGKTAFNLIAITGAATIVLSFVFYNTAQIAAKDYGNVVNWYEDVRYEEVMTNSADQKVEIQKFYSLMAQNPKELSRREYYKLKSQYRAVIYTK